MLRFAELAGRARLILVAAAVAVGGCYSGGEPCGAEFRTATASGDFGGTGAQRLGFVDLGVYESRDATSVPSFSVSLNGPSYTESGPLRNHIAKVRVLGAGGTELFVPEVRPVGPEYLGGLGVGSTYLIRDSTQFADLRAQLLAGVLTVEVTTDESPARVFTVHTAVTRNTDWAQVYCK